MNSNLNSFHLRFSRRRVQWEKGLVKAGGQNLARYLMEMPSNHMTPTIFAQVILNFIIKNDWTTVK